MDGMRHTRLSNQSEEEEDSFLVGIGLHFLNSWHATLHSLPPIVSRDLDASKLTQGLLHIIIIIIGVRPHERSHPTLFSFPICSSLLVNVFWYLPTFLYYISHINLVKFIFPPTNNNTWGRLFRLLATKRRDVRSGSWFSSSNPRRS